MDNATRTISSQRYIDEDIVAAKLAAKDYTIHVSPAFDVDGKAYRVVLDGHHSLEAARRAGVEPEVVEVEDETVESLERGLVQEFLERHHHGDDYYDIATGRDVW